MNLQAGIGGPKPQPTYTTTTIRIPTSSPDVQNTSRPQPTPYLPPGRTASELIDPLLKSIRNSVTLTQQNQQKGSLKTGTATKNKTHVKFADTPTPGHMTRAATEALNRKAAAEVSYEAQPLGPVKPRLLTTPVGPKRRPKESTMKRKKRRPTVDLNLSDTDQEAEPEPIVLDSEDEDEENNDQNDDEDGPGSGARSESRP